MKRSRALTIIIALLAIRVVYAEVILVPEARQKIQDAINRASDGDTISVWGPPPGLQI